MKKLLLILTTIICVLTYFFFKSETEILFLDTQNKPTDMVTIKPTISIPIQNDLFNNISLKNGSYSFAYFDPNSNQEYKINPNEEFYYASIFKIPVAIEVFKNIDSKKYTLNDKFEYTEQDYATGDGSLRYEDFDSEYSIEQLLTLLLKNSDNVAMNIFIREFGQDNVYQTALNLGTSKSFANDNIGTISDGITMFKTIDSTNIISDQSKKLLYKLLSDTSFEDRIQPGLKVDSTLVHKIGTWPDTNSFHDCGIVINPNYKYFICVLTKGTTLTEAQDLSTKLSKITESFY